MGNTECRIIGDEVIVDKNETEALHEIIYNYIQSTSLKMLSFSLCHKLTLLIAKYIFKRLTAIQILKISKQLECCPEALSISKFYVLFIHILHSVNFIMEEHPKTRKELHDVVIKTLFIDDIKINPYLTLPVLKAFSKNIKQYYLNIA